MNTSAKFNALFRDVSVGALSALTIHNPTVKSGMPVLDITTTDYKQF